MVEKGEDESFWIANVYNMDTLPKSVMVNMAGNDTNHNRGASTGEIFRDMAAICRNLAQAADKTLAQYLTFAKQGEKGKVVDSLWAQSRRHHETFDGLVKSLGTSIDRLGQVRGWAGIFPAARCTRDGAGAVPAIFHSFLFTIQQFLPIHHGRHSPPALQQQLTRRPYKYIYFQQEVKDATSLFWKEKGLDCTETVEEGLKRNPLISTM